MREIAAPPISDLESDIASRRRATWRTYRCDWAENCAGMRDREIVLEDPQAEAMLERGIAHPGMPSVTACFAKDSSCDSPGGQ